MNVSRIPFVFALLAFLFVLPGIGQTQEPIIVPGIGEAQEPIAAPASWCMHWTDNCTSCSRRSSANAEFTCRSAERACTAARVRCTWADQKALRAVCETPKTTADNSCNKCSQDAAGNLRCTAMLCNVEVVCLVPRE